MAPARDNDHSALVFIRHCVALPWVTKLGPLPRLAGWGWAAAEVFGLFWRLWPGWKVHCGAGVSPVVSVLAWTV